MTLSRILVIVALGLSVATACHAAEQAVFAVARQDDSGKPRVFESTRPLKKGDVLRIRAFNSQPVMVLQMAMCDGDCRRPRRVSTLPLMACYDGQASISQPFVMPEDGRIAFWVQRLGDLPSEPVNTRDGAWRMQYVAPFLRVATSASGVPQPSVQPLSANALSVEDGTLHARYFHRTFITVSLANSHR